MRQTLPLRKLFELAREPTWDKVGMKRTEEPRKKGRRGGEKKRGALPLSNSRTRQIYPSDRVVMKKGERSEGGGGKGEGEGERGGGF